MKKSSSVIVEYSESKTHSKISDYAQFMKLRLSFLVILSAFFSFILASQGLIDWQKLIFLTLGGFLVTGSANGFNQIIERDSDKMMDRTANRPLPAGRMTVKEAWILAFLTGIVGIILLGIFVNLWSGVLGALALLMYTLLYTPLKPKTPFAVFIGAFPGAIPPLLGWIAATNTFQIQALLVFAIQFVWQFPHFWAIAWVLDDDYKKAGFNMLPSKGGRDKSSAFQILIYTLSLMPISLMPLLFHMSGTFSAFIIMLCGILFTLQAIKLFKTCSIKSATQLMLGSFIYLPLVQIALMLDKI